MDTVEHAPAHTLEELVPLVWKRAEALGAAVAKNLFLRDKRRQLYLLSVRHDRELNLNDIGAHSDSVFHCLFACCQANAKISHTLENELIEN